MNLNNKDGLIGLTEEERLSIRNMEICYEYDQTNLTIADVAERWGLSILEVKDILLKDSMK